jgi:hypothetical protein
MFFAEDHPPLQLEKAYGVQAEVAKLRSVAGESIAGYNIGCIGPKIREAFGMSGPIRGFLFKSELRASGSAVSASRHMKVKWRQQLLSLARWQSRRRYNNTLLLRTLNLPLLNPSTNARKATFTLFHGSLQDENIAGEARKEGEGRAAASEDSLLWGSSSAWPGSRAARSSERSVAGWGSAQ